jgi:hypothetical protein
MPYGRQPIPNPLKKQVRGAPRDPAVVATRPEDLTPGLISGLPSKPAIGVLRYPGVIRSPGAITVQTVPWNS